MEDMTGRSTRGYEGVTCSFFLEKKKEPKKNRLGLSPAWVLFIRFMGYGFLIREAARLVLSLDFFICYEPAAFTMFVSAFITRFVI